MHYRRLKKMLKSKLVGEPKKEDLSIGIVMPVHNCIGETKNAIGSFRTKYKHEWIIIDNASTDYTQRWIQEKMKGPRFLLTQKENIGVARSWNLGIAKAFERGHDLAFVVNNDIVFAQDTLDNLMEWYSGGQICSVVSIGPDSSRLPMYSRKKLGVPQASFIGFLIDPKVIERVGWFDEEYELAYFEDDDYKMRCRSEGVQMMGCLDAPVAHRGSQAIKQGGVQHEPQFTENKKRFASKWGFVSGLVVEDKPKLLWFGDAGGCQTGFARVTENVLMRLAAAWDVHVVGLNYDGDPHAFPFPIYPAINGGDWKGLGRFESVVEAMRPDVTVIFNDHYIVRDFVEKNKEIDTLLVGYMPIDAEHIRYDWARELNGLDLAILYTEFGREQLTKSGYEGKTEVIPHGVDPKIYHPVDKIEARRSIGLEGLDDYFIVGNVNNDQPRKRLDLTVEFFCKWVARMELPEEVVLYTHTKTEGIHCDLQDLFSFWSNKLYGDKRMLKRWICTGTDTMKVKGTSELNMKYVYSALDMQITTTMGEGWGLTQLEGMACGIPQIAPRYAALGEWGKDAMRLVDVHNFQCAPGNLNTIGGVVTADDFIKAMNDVYSNPHALTMGRDVSLSRSAKFRWDNIAARFDTVLRKAIEEKRNGGAVRNKDAESPKEAAAVT
jgi:GT2 family glycosyltransferase/glycosyltransferase involved in cell wall biosynthesis